MSNDLNRFAIIGRLTKDAELRTTGGGTSVANFSIANNRSYTVENEKKEFTSFLDCIAWGKLGEVIAQYCTKGKQVALDGRIQQRSWDDKDGRKRSSVELVVDNFQILTKNESGNQEPNGNVKEPIMNNPFSDDSIPF